MVSGDFGQGRQGRWSLCTTRIRYFIFRICKYGLILKKSLTAEFRGPGMRQNIEDSGDDYDLDMDHRNHGVGGRSGRIILLGDGREVVTESDETEMFDHEEEDKDLASQAGKGQTNLDDASRSEREETPGPESRGPSERHQTPESKEQNSFDTSSSNTSETSSITDTAKSKIKAIPESALPEKLVTPPTSQEKK